MDYKAIYEKAFASAGYSLPAQDDVQYAFAIASIRTVSRYTIIDVCSGRGLFLDLLAEAFPDSSIQSVDLANFHGRPHPFAEIDLSNPKSLQKLRASSFSVLTCLGSLEHLEEHLIDDVLATFAICAPRAVLTIANHSDTFDGVELHVIQQPEPWWRLRLEKHFRVLEQRSFYDGRLFTYFLESLR